MTYTNTILFIASIISVSIIAIFYINSPSIGTTYDNGPVVDT